MDDRCMCCQSAFSLIKMQSALLQADEIQAKPTDFCQGKQGKCDKTAH